MIVKIGVISIRLIQVTLILLFFHFLLEHIPFNDPALPHAGLIRSVNNESPHRAIKWMRYARRNDVPKELDHGIPSPLFVPLEVHRFFSFA